MRYRNLAATKYDGSKQRGPGRLPTKQDITELVGKMAREAPSWAYKRLNGACGVPRSTWAIDRRVLVHSVDSYTPARGALHNLGHAVARDTIKNILIAHGLEPAPERGRHTGWQIFIKSHLGAIAGADFFTLH